MKTLLKVEHLSKKVENKWILKDVHFDLFSGETFGIMGHNGAGKTTLLNCLCKVSSWCEGAVHWDLDQRSFYHAIGVQRQMNYFETHAKVKDVFQLYLRIIGVGVNLNRYLSTFGLDNMTGSIVNQLSFGERQKMNLALALLHEPKVLILDEMTSGVDVLSKKHLWDIVKKIKEEKNMTIIFVSHDVEEIKTHANRAMILNKGEVVHLEPITPQLDLEKIYIEKYGEA